MDWVEPIVNVINVYDFLPLWFTRISPENITGILNPIGLWGAGRDPVIEIDRLISFDHLYVGEFAW